MKPYVRIAYSILIILLIGSCGTKKKFLKAPSVKTTELKTAIYQDIFEGDRPLWFSGKAKLTFTENEKSTKAVMYLRQRYDSLNWMVVKKLSVEAARSFITKDSLFIIYRMDKAYQASSLDSITHVFGFEPEFEFIADLSIGRLPKVDSTKLWEEKQGTEYYEFRSMHKDLVMDFRYDKKKALLTDGRFYDRFGRTGEWSYSDYRMINGHTLPFQREFRIKFANGDSLKLGIEFVEMEINVAQNTGFRIPGHYKKIE